MNSKSTHPAKSIIENPDGLLRVGEVGLMLSKSPSAIYRMASRGTIPHKKIGKSLRFSRREIVSYIRELDGVSLESALETVKEVE